MIQRSRGWIINITSGAAIGDISFTGAYTASKAALSQYSKILGGQLDRTGVTVFAYAPGFVRTAMVEGVSNSQAVHSSIRNSFNEVIEGSADPPLENCVNMFMVLASGKADELSGRFVSVYDEDSDLPGQVEEIKQNDLYTLRLHTE
jgi:NAD(P)-dependent dehydrogenase (short-subunit alcohol dehydrogenase family)